MKTREGRGNLRRRSVLCLILLLFCWRGDEVVVKSQLGGGSCIWTWQLLPGSAFQLTMRAKMIQEPPSPPQAPGSQETRRWGQAPNVPWSLTGRGE